MPSHHHDPAARAGETHKKSESHLTLRKRLRKAAERKYQQKVAWFGGILYFTGNLASVTRFGGEPETVPGVQHVPKPNAQAVGYYVAQVKPPYSEPEYRSTWKPSASVSNEPWRRSSSW